MGTYNWDKLGKHLDEHWETGFEEVDAMIAEGIKEGKSPRTARGMLRYYENKLNALKNERAFILEEWHKISVKQVADLTKFRIIQGRNTISKFRGKLYESAKKEIYIINTGNELIRSTFFGLDDILEKCAQNDLTIKVISKIDKQNIS